MQTDNATTDDGGDNANGGNDSAMECFSQVTAATMNKVAKRFCLRQFTYNQRAPTRATDKADNAATTDDGGIHDGSDGSATTARRKYDGSATAVRRHNNEGDSDGDEGGGGDGCGDNHVVLGGFASSRRFHTVPLTYGKGKY